MSGNNLNLRIFLTGVGGQGTLLASRLLGEAALAAGYSPLVSETHGMAQRGGVVVSTVVLGNLQSPLISSGEADILLGFEALEAFRALDRCHAGSLVIANSRRHRALPGIHREKHLPGSDSLAGSHGR